MKFISFDIETATITPDNDDPHKYRPLGICCAATQLVDTDLGELGIQPPVGWCNFSDNSVSPDSDPYGLKMTPFQVQGLVQYLLDMKAGGWIPLTWNGLGFDFDILAEEARDQRVGLYCVGLAVDHYDIAFQMLCDKGFMIGMQAAALGLELPGKSEGMHGDLAPKLWAQSRADQDKVLAYCKQDVQTTSEIALKAIEYKRIPWTSKAGRPNTWLIKSPGLLTVRESLGLPLPDTAWMSEPRSRKSYYEWTSKYLKEE